MITITEFPHRGPSRTWTADNREDFIRRVRADIERRRGEADPLTYDDCVAYLESDLRELEISATYRIELSVDQQEAEQFRDWLAAQGHDATIGRSTGSYVDGVSTTTPEAGEIMRALWAAYCGE